MKPSDRKPSDRTGNPLDEFPQTSAREAVVAVVRGFGALQRLMEPYFARFGISPPQFQVLTIVSRLRHLPVTQRRLAQELYVSFPNMSMLLDRLEHAGLVRRRTNRQDRRAKFVRLTPKGRALLMQIWKVHQQQLDHVMTGLNDRERLQLAGLLNKMIAAHASAATTRKAAEGD